MKFLIAVIDTKVHTGTQDEIKQVDSFNEKLGSNGQLILAAGLDTAKILVTADGEYMSGFWIIETDSLQEAEALAAEGSKACNRKVELRPFLGN
ncbi:MAG: YciI family protein [Micrococcales bacterium]